MPRKPSQEFPHIYIKNTAGSEPYTNPSADRPRFVVNERNRQSHGQMLKAQLTLAEVASKKRVLSIPQERLATPGVYIQFESDPGFELKLESLDDRTQGIELIAVETMPPQGGKAARMTATVLVPEGKIDRFIRKVEKYLSEETESGKPKNQNLVESIANVRLATLRSLWTDAERFPKVDSDVWWEIWLRAGQSNPERERILKAFREQAAESQLAVKEGELVFPETSVVLVRGTARQITQSVFLLNAIAEIRRAKDTADFFTGLRRDEQAEWVREIVERIIQPHKSAPAVCLLDTGVNNDHPLLIIGLNAKDMLAYNPDWGITDHYGHGTEMAGLSLYGDLTDLLQTSGKIHLNHKLESVKILPPNNSNDPELYGAITIESMARAEVNSPNRNRAFCLTVSTTDFRDRGQPSSWSAAIDQICSGAGEEDNQRRLILIAAGNTDKAKWSQYPDSNATDEIHDPAQSWNAITVGAYTDKDTVDPSANPGWVPLAPRGGLSPCSTTSLTWSSQWPIKPDVVVEGGNMAKHPQLDSPDYMDSLLLLSTNARWQQKLLVSTGDTSGATALAAGMCARIYAEYPDIWPETVRGLLIHSAIWSPEMRMHRELREMSSDQLQNMLQTFGYGAPDLERALYSASDDLTLVAEEKLQPFIKEGNSQPKSNEMHLHALPWPQDVLSELGEVEVEMRVTLSYFIEPKPERRGFKNKYRYMSHGLRFETKAPTETVDGFRRRINRVAREGGGGYSSSMNDSDNWLLGSRLRCRGSIHSDIWQGRAADLADKGHIAVIPVNGWWRDRPHLGKSNNVARYCLIVTIRTPEVYADIYTPVMNLIVV